MNLLEKLEYQNNKIRVVEKDNQVYFVGIDVARALGYSNTYDALNRHLDDDEKGVVDHDTLGGKQKVTIINESGLYHLIFSSKLDKATSFRKWVTEEVLPDIRKYGMYINDEFAKAVIDNPEEAKKEMIKYYNESERLSKIVKDLETENKELKANEKELINLENKLEFLQSRPENNDWKKEANKRVRKLAPKITGFVHTNYGQVWNEVYREMLYSQNINIKSKHTRRLTKMKSNNVPQSIIDNTTIVDTIGTDVDYVDKMFKAIDSIEDKYKTPQKLNNPFGGLEDY